MDRTAEIERLVQPALEQLGYDLVRVRFDGGGHRTLQIMAERQDRREMSVEDCAQISRNLSAILDVEDPIVGSYALEVSSPGIDRPLVGRDDYERFAGFDAKIEAHRLLDGRKRFKGKLAGMRGEDVLVECDGAERAIPLAEIASAKLLLTDELIAATMKNRDG